MAWIDFLIVLAAWTIVFYLQLDRLTPTTAADDVVRQVSWRTIAFPVLFGVYLVSTCKLHGLYLQEVVQSGVQEQRKTVQATLTAGLLLFGTLYLVPGYFVPRATVIATAILALVMLMLRRAVWRHITKRHHLGNLGGRNILIVGEGGRAEALREHLCTVHNTGVRFKGFISLLPHGDLLSHPDVVASLDDCVAVARALFVDDIYVAMPLERGRAGEFDGN
jgi:FlaA1/EpsC-like NDP-sugar epimerase